MTNTPGGLLLVLTVLVPFVGVLAGAPQREEHK